MNESNLFLAELINDTDSVLLEDLKQVLRQHHSAHPRSQQRELGPSQIGHPCARHLASTIAGLEKVNPNFDPLPSYIGVAVHKQLEKAVALDNSTRESNGLPARWLSEQRVEITPGLSGTADLVDKETKTVIDLKCPGASKMTEYRRNGPSETYRIQAHLYAYGFNRAGIDIERVAIWLLPRAGALSSSVICTETYDESVAAQAISRYHGIIELVDELDIEKNPEKISMIVRENSQCAFCPWYSKGGTTVPAACDGDGYKAEHRDRTRC